MTEYRVNAKYVTVWDGGETSIESDCVVDLAERKIISISDEREINGPYSEDEVDDSVECLDMQYIILPGGAKYPVVEYGFSSGYAECGGEEKIPFEL